MNSPTLTKGESSTSLEVVEAPKAVPLVTPETVLKVGDRVINPPEYIQGGMCNWYGIVTEVTPEGAYIIWGTGGEGSKPYFFPAEKYYQLTFDPRGPVLGVNFRPYYRGFETGVVVGVNREGFFVDWGDLSQDMPDHVAFGETGDWDFSPPGKIPWEHLEVLAFREDIPPVWMGSAPRQGFYPLSDPGSRLKALHKFRARDPGCEVFLKADGVRYTIIPSDIDWTGLPDL